MCGSGTDADPLSRPQVSRLAIASASPNFGSLNSPAAVLLRESWREDGKVRKRTLANLSCLAPEVIEGLKVLLRGGVAVPSANERFVVDRSLPHGHVAAVLGSARGCGAAANSPRGVTPVTASATIRRSSSG